MNPDLDLTTRLDALGRSLALSVPQEPPAAFMEGVRRQHRVTLVKRTLAGVALLAVLTCLVYFAATYKPPPGQGPRGSAPAQVMPGDDLDTK